MPSNKPTARVASCSSRCTRSGSAPAAAWSADSRRNATDKVTSAPAMFPLSTVET